MISLGKYTIKDILKDAASEEESHPPSPVVAKKGRKRKNLRAKAKATVDSEESDATDDKSTKSVSGKGVKHSLKPNDGSQCSKMEQKAIVKDNTLLIPEIVESGQTELDERHLCESQWCVGYPESYKKLLGLNFSLPSYLCISSSCNKSFSPLVSRCMMSSTSDFIFVSLSSCCVTFMTDNI